MITLGNTEITKAYLGNTKINKMYLGEEIVFGGDSPTPVFPYDAQVEYLQSNGSQWIDTGIYADNTTKTEIGFQLTSLNASRGIYGTFSSPKSYYIFTSRSKTWQVGFGEYADLSAATLNYHEFVFDSFKVYIDGVLANTYSSQTFTNTQTQTVFNMKRSNGTIYTGTPMKLFYLRMYQNGVLVRDMIPVRLESVGYMYDKVSGDLFGNSGTGAFTYGNDVTT